MRFALLMLLAAAGAAQAQTRGTLIVMGGGPWHDEVQKRFVELAGGANGLILVLPMASASTDSGRSSVKGWEELGGKARALVVNKEEAMRADTAALFRGVTGIWFGGGDQSRLTAAIAGTPVEAAIRNRYQRGAVVGGTSAGAAVMSRMMITGDERRFGGARPPSDSSQAFITIDRQNVVTAEGFGYIDNVIIDQHFVRRRRHNRLISLVLENPRLVGAGIDESTAIEVRPDGTWKVLGASVVVIYDARKARVGPGTQTLSGSNVQMHILPSGATYNPKNGKASFATRR